LVAGSYTLAAIFEYGVSWIQWSEGAACTVAGWPEGTGFRAERDDVSRLAEPLLKGVVEMELGNLVLTREIGERVTLLDAQGKHLATVTVVERSGVKIRLGFEAEPEIEIIRTELLPSWKGRGVA
jgi:sRNA-binding carbon storage regulator CsrA